MIKKVFKSIGFVGYLVKLAHIKSNYYMWAVAKLSQMRTKQQHGR